MGMREAEGDGRKQLLGNLRLTLESLAVLPLSYTGLSYGIRSQLPPPAGPDLPFEAWKGREGLLQDTEILVWSCYYSDSLKLCYIKIGMEFRLTLAYEMKSNFA